MLRYIVLFLVILPVCSARPFYHIRLPPGAVGPESVAFDCQAQGPYVGVSDGRILKLVPGFGWTHFATMPTWSPTCIGTNNSPAERSCGRPLGLKFHPQTCDLYVADAYYGLVEISREGGQGHSVALAAEGIPFKFTNSLDIHPESGVVYFTDTSTRFDRLEFPAAINSGDRTGRLMVYNPHDHTTRVLLNHLSFANGVALSRNNDFLLISETTTGQIHKFWLKGPRYHTRELLLTIQGLPDNINRDPAGNFWIAQVQSGSRPPSRDGGVPIKINEQGQILELLDGRRGERVTLASDVKEFRGRVWIGSVVNPYVEVSYY